MTKDKQYKVSNIIIMREVETFSSMLSLSIRIYDPSNRSNSMNFYRNIDTGLCTEYNTKRTIHISFLQEKCLFM